jgi:hypothetical protein
VGGKQPGLGWAHTRSGCAGRTALGPGASARGGLGPSPHRRRRRAPSLHATTEAWVGFPIEDGGGGGLINGTSNDEMERRKEKLGGALVASNEVIWESKERKPPRRANQPGQPEGVAAAGRQQSRARKYLTEYRPGGRRWPQGGWGRIDDRGAGAGECTPCTSRRQAAEGLQD